MIVTQWFTQCGDQEVCTEPAPPPEVPGMSWREAGKSVSSESGVCSAAVSAMLRSLPSLGLACGCKSVQQGLRTVSHQSPSPMPCLPGGLPQASIPPPPPLAVHTRAQGAEGPRPPPPAPVLVGRAFPSGTRLSTPFCKTCSFANACSYISPGEGDAIHSGTTAWKSHGQRSRPCIYFKQRTFHRAFSYKGFLYFLFVTCSQFTFNSLICPFSHACFRLSSTSLTKYFGVLLGVTCREPQMSGPARGLWATV